MTRVAEATDPMDLSEAPITGGHTARAGCSRGSRWCVDEHGRNSTIWPGFTWRYWLRTRKPDAGAYEFGH